MNLISKMSSEIILKFITTSPREMWYETQNFVFILDTFQQPVHFE